MPRGIPSLFNKERREELAAGKPRPEVLGTFNPNARINDTEPRPAEWVSESGETISLVEPPPPWEVATDANGKISSDARLFVKCPDNWRLHWINPRLLDSEGWRDWQAVMVSDPRVTLLVPTMKSPEGYVRRGGHGGDILAWMWKGWYESKKKQMEKKIALQTQSAVDQQQQLREEFARGTYGPHMRIEGTTHPTHTQGEGQTMRD